MYVIILVRSSLWLISIYSFCAAKHSAPCSLIISVNRRHFNDLCFVFGFPFPVYFSFFWDGGISGIGVSPFVWHQRVHLNAKL